AHVIDQADTGAAQTWSAWVAEVRVDAQSGQIDVTRLTVGHHTEALAPQAQPAGPALEDEVRRAALQLLQAPQTHDAWDGQTADSPWALTPPAVQLVQPQSHALDQPLAWSPHAALPAAA